MARQDEFQRFEQIVPIGAFKGLTEKWLAGVTAQSRSYHPVLYQVRSIQVQHSNMVSCSGCCGNKAKSLWIFEYLRSVIHFFSRI